MTDTIENQNPESPRDWAWDVPEKYDLHVNGGLLLDAVKPVSDAVGNWRFASVTSKPFGIEENVCIPKPDEKPPKKKKQAGTPQYGRWRVKIAPNWSELTPEQEVKAEDILQDLPVIYIKTPEKDGVYDEFTAGQFATILANALNMYKEFAEHWREKKLDVDSPDSDPLISSWKFVQEHIIPLLKTQFVEAAKKAAEEQRLAVEQDKVPEDDELEEDEENENSAGWQPPVVEPRKYLEEPPVRRTPMQNKNVAKMLRLLASMAHDYATRIDNGWPVE